MNAFEVKMYICYQLSRDRVQTVFIYKRASIAAMALSKTAPRPLEKDEYYK